MNKKLLAGIGVGIVAGTIVLMSGGNSATVEVDPCVAEDGTYEVTLVTDVGGINDKSFNQGTWEGVRKYCTENPDVDATYIETNDPATMETNLNTAASQSEIVIIPGFNAVTPISNVAPEHPDTQFVLIDAELPEPQPNVKSYMFSAEDAGYLVGYIAGKTTKTNHIGFIGGEEIPNVTPFADGYIAGAEAANPGVQVDVLYADTFVDSTKGQTMADTMYSNGCDIIFAAAGGTGIGVINSAIQHRQQGEDVWAIGVDVDQYAEGTYTTPEGVEESAVLTSAMKNVGVAAYDALTEFYNGTFTQDTEVMTVENGGVGLPATNPNVDQALIDEAFASCNEWNENK